MDFLINFLRKNVCLIAVVKYVNKNKKYQLLTEYDKPLISFSNSYYKGNKYGVQDYINVKIFNYVLFWNKVNSLDEIK